MSMASSSERMGAPRPRGAATSSRIAATCRPASSRTRNRGPFSPIVISLRRTGKVGCSRVSCSRARTLGYWLIGVPLRLLGGLRQLVGQVGEGLHVLAVHLEGMLALVQAEADE